MTPEDRDLLAVLRLEQDDLRRSLAQLDAQLSALAIRAEPGPALLPPLPAHPLPPPVPASHLPPSPAPPIRSVLPPVPPPPPPPGHRLPLVPSPRPSLEFQFGRWLTRIGAVFGIISLVLILSLTHALLFRLLGPLGILALSAAVCLGIVIGAERLERRGGSLLIFGRSLLAMGLAGLYVTFYAAHSVDALRVIQSPVAAGLLLLLWSAYVLRLADAKRSQALAFFALALAYFSTAINPIDRFTMAADLLLAGTAVIMLLRHGWAALSYLSLLGTYLALLRRLLIDENGEIVLDTGRALPFAPYAVYLIGAWIVFTAAVLLTLAKSFRGGKRIIFLSLNNGALAGLLTLTTYIAGYGFKAMGWTLLWTGVAFLATAGFAEGQRPDAQFAEVSSAYLAQGLAAFTAGIMGIFAGITRGIMLALETLFLGLASRFSRGAILPIATAVAAFFAALYLAWEISVSAHHPWLLGFGGALVMLINAGVARLDRRPAPLTHQRMVPLASYYCLLAVGLIAAALVVELSDSTLPPALALAALGLTALVYVFPLYELPPLAQTLLLSAQALVLFPTETGEALPRWSTAGVAAITFVLLTWWSRQRSVHYRGWVVALTLTYAFALVGLAYHAVRPFVDEQNWMISASLLSALFLLFGALTRVWSLAVMGQLFLLAALAHFFFPGGSWGTFPWGWAAAAVPIVVTFATGRGILSWLREFAEIVDPARKRLRLLGYTYEVLGWIMVTRALLARVPVTDQIATFLLLGTAVMIWNTVRPHAFGVRCGLGLSAVGLLLLVQGLQVNEGEVLTLLNGIALLALLCQPALLRHSRPDLVSDTESWLLVLFSAAVGWWFVSAGVVERLHPHYLTVGWAIYALFLFFLGFVTWERRQRWCGLVILAAALIRVIFNDIWGFSNGYKVLTFVVLTLITLGLGFIYARFAERLKTWL